MAKSGVELVEVTEKTLKEGEEIKEEEEEMEEEKEGKYVEETKGEPEIKLGDYKIENIQKLEEELLKRIQAVEPTAEVKVTGTEKKEEKK